jgi:hypothetical protein
MVMKRFFYLVLFLFIIKGHCFGQQVLPSAEIVEYKKPNLGPYFQSPDTVKIDLNHLQIDDTIVISGFINDDCGEFVPSHYERIYISRKKNNLYCWLKIDSNNCFKLRKSYNYFPSKKIYKNPYSDTILLQKKKKKSIIHYFNEFGVLAETYSYLHELAVYSIIKNGRELYYRLDPYGKWACFINLKNKLFLK